MGVCTGSVPAEGCAEAEPVDVEALAADAPGVDALAVGVAVAVGVCVAWARARRWATHCAALVRS